MNIFIVENLISKSRMFNDPKSYKNLISSKAIIIRLKLGT